LDDIIEEECKPRLPPFDWMDENRRDVIVTTLSVTTVLHLEMMLFLASIGTIILCGGMLILRAVFD
jgi:hypothetical protein